MRNEAVEGTKGTAQSGGTVVFDLQKFERQSIADAGGDIRPDNSGQSCICWQSAEDLIWYACLDRKPFET